MSEVGASVNASAILGLGFVIAIVVLAVVLGILRFRPDFVRVDVATQALRVKEMAAEIDQLRGQIRLLLDQLVTSEAKSRAAELKAREAEIKIAELKEQVRVLREQLEAKKLIAPIPQDKLPMHVLGIWPTVPGQVALDQQAEADALYNAGFAYTALRGARANRVGVILEIDRVRPTIIQCGGHGNREGIMLSDGIAEPGWWGEVVRGKAIQLMVLLSCDSSQQDELNVSDALIRVGVRAVISCDDKIADRDAVRFVELLYAKLSEGVPLAEGVQRAKLAVSRAAGEMIRLRLSGNPLGANGRHSEAANG